MLTCRYPERRGLGKLPCEFKAHDSRACIYRDVKVASFDLSIYNRTDNVPSSFYCVMLCISMDCLAFVFDLMSNTCWQHVTRSICRRKNIVPLRQGSKVMVRKVGISCQFVHKCRP
jgi:hypothetical protein